VFCHEFLPPVRFGKWGTSSLQADPARPSTEVHTANLDLCLSVAGLSRRQSVALLFHLRKGTRSEPKIASGKMRFLLHKQYCQTGKDGYMSWKGRWPNIRYVQLLFLILPTLSFGQRRNQRIRHRHVNSKEPTTDATSIATILQLR